MGRTRAFWAALLGLVLVWGCAKPAPTPTPPAPTPGPVTAPTPTPRAATPTPTPTPVAALKPTGELRIAMGYTGPEVGDPSLSSVESNKLYLWPIYDPLVGANPYEAELDKDRGLAERWEVSHSPTSSTYTFYLRKGIKFHNGEELTSEDVKFSLEYYMRPVSVTTYVATLRAYIDRVETPERYKVVIHTKKPYAFLLVDLSLLVGTEGMVLPKKYIQEKGEDYFNLYPIGTGPYRFKDRQVGSYVKFEALEGEHWLMGVPKYKTVTFFLIPEESTRIAMLKVGQADIIEVSRERLKELADFKVFLKSPSEVVMGWMGNQWQPDTYLYDKRVREALNLAVNREEVLKFIFEGQGEIVGNGYYGSGALDYKPLPLYPYDPERAKKLLAEAFPKGVELTINSYLRPGVPELMRVNEALAGFWGKVGVKSKIVPMEYTTHRTKLQRGELANIASGMAFGATRSFWQGGWRTVLHSKGLLPMTKDPKLDALIEGVEGELDLAKAAQRQWETAQYIREEHKVVSLLEVGAPFAANRQKVTEWNLGKLFVDFNFPDLVRRR